MKRAALRVALVVAIVVSLTFALVPSASGVAMDLFTQKIIAQNDPVIVVGTALEWAQPDVYGNYAAWQVRRKDADGMRPGHGARRLGCLRLRPSDGHHEARFERDAPGTSVARGSPGTGSCTRTTAPVPATTTSTRTTS